MVCTQPTNNSIVKKNIVAIGVLSDRSFFCCCPNLAAKCRQGSDKRLAYRPEPTRLLKGSFAAINPGVGGPEPRLSAPLQTAVVKHIGGGQGELDVQGATRARPAGSGGREEGTSGADDTLLGQKGRF